MESTQYEIATMKGIYNTHIAKSTVYTYYNNVGEIMVSAKKEQINYYYTRIWEQKFNKNRVESIASSDSDIILHCTDL